MGMDPQHLRLQGTYQQRQPGYVMQRVKVPGGLLSAEQALVVARIAERFAGGCVHLTTRCSIELHWVKEEALPEIWRMLESVGLTSRGACGGAVRGISCSTPFLDGFPAVQALARTLQQHFTRNPRFEGLPKKFKIGVDAGYQDSRHLIQDVGLVLAGTEGEEKCYDVWVAGGLGREPQAAFLLEGGVPEERIIPLIEAVIAVYKRHAPQGKRLKHLVRERGEEGVRSLLREELAGKGPFGFPGGGSEGLALQPGSNSLQRLEARIFAGELTASSLRRMAEIATVHAKGVMTLTCEQNVAFPPVNPADAACMAAALVDAGFDGKTREERVPFRICPGSHECRLGLVPTRDIARIILAAVGEKGEGLSWAIAGCPNSCTQPQLAEVGIIAVKLAKDEDGERTPRFDLYRRTVEAALGSPVRQGITLADLIEAARELG